MYFILEFLKSTFRTFLAQFEVLGVKTKLPKLFVMVKGQPNWSGLCI